jgi:H+/Cl- antiporter ClcA
MNEPLLERRNRQPRPLPLPPLLDDAFHVRRQQYSMNNDTNKTTDDASRHNGRRSRHEQPAMLETAPNENHNYESSRDESDPHDEEDVYQQENERGRPRPSRTKNACCHACLDFLLAAILGLVTGGGGLLFLVATHWFRRQWTMTILPFCIPETSISMKATLAKIMSSIFSSFTISSIQEEPKQQIAAAAAATSSSKCQDSLWFLLITAMGGLLTALTFCICRHTRTEPTPTDGRQPTLMMPMPSIPVVRTLFHDLNAFPCHHLYGDVQVAAAAAAASSSAAAVSASFWTLISGAPLGPEQALGSMATFIACLRTKLLLLGARCAGHEIQYEQQVEWIRICMAAMVGGLLGNPILGPIFVQELSRFVVMSTSKTRLDPMVRDEPLETNVSGRRQQPEEHEQYSNVIASNSNGTSPPVFLGRGINSDNHISRQQPLQQQQRQQVQHSAQLPPHNAYMRGWILQLVASLFAGLWLQVWFTEWLPYHALAPLPHQQQQQDDYFVHVGAVNPMWMLYWNTTGRYLFMAIPLGLVCGLFGMVAICIMTTTRWIRHATCRLVLQELTTSAATTCRANILRVFLLVLFPTMAGLLHGCLTLYIVSPLIKSGGGAGLTTMMDGLLFIQSTWNQAAAASNVTCIIADDIDVDESTTFLYSRQTLVILAAVQIVGMAVSLGWGLVGGSILPMLVAGLCMGLALVNEPHDDKDDNGNNDFLYLPIALTVPCCMAAMVVCICPIPLSMTLGICSIFRFHYASNNDGDGNDDWKITGPVMVACLTAWAVTGGSGFLYGYEKVRKMEYDRLPLPQTAGGGGEEEERTGLGHFSNGHGGCDGGDCDGDDDEYTGAGLTSDASSDDELLRNIRSAIFGRI